MRRIAGGARLEVCPAESGSLVERARLGDRAAIGDIYAELAPGVIGYMRGAGARDPEDLAGDVFVSMVRGLPDFEGDESALRRWVFTIAHHRLIDMRRRETVRAVESPLTGNDDCPVADPYDGVLDRLGAAPAVRALARLTPEQRDVLLLRSVVGLSVSDTAAVLQRTPGSTKTIHRRAIAALSRLVDREAVS
jgi:RNA polymerase sigma-70 factor (ECF subfamily)